MKDNVKDSEYLENLFLAYIPTLNAINKASESFYSKDEFKLRHKIFKQIFAKYRSYKLKLMIENFKNNILNFSEKRRKKQIEKTIKDYNKLKESGIFLPDRKN